MKREKIREAALKMVKSWTEDIWPEDPVDDIERFAVMIHNSAINQAARLSDIRPAEYVAEEITKGIRKLKIKKWGSNGKKKNRIEKTVSDAS